MSLGISAGQHRRDGDVLGIRVGDEQGFLRRLLEAVFDQEVQVIPLVQDLALDVRIQLLEAPGLAVLLRDELLVEGRDLDVKIERREIEVRRETLCRVPLTIPIDVEGRRLVFPRDLIEVQKLGELAFTVVGELDGLVRKGYGRFPCAVRAFWDG